MTNLKGNRVTYFVEAKVVVSNKTLDVFEKMAKRVPFDHPEAKLPEGHTKWDALAVMSAVLQMEAESTEGVNRHGG